MLKMSAIGRNARWVVCSNFRRITHRSGRCKLFNAENHIFAYPLVFDLELERHTIGM